MWSGDRDANEDGEPILLLLPASTAAMNDPSSSHAGGLPRYHDDDPRGPPSFPPSSSVVGRKNDDAFASSGGTSGNPACTTCGGRMHLLLQLHAPLDDYDRTMYVFGCNNAPCHTPSTGRSDDDDDGDEQGGNAFRSWIGGGPVRCLRSQRKWTAARSESTSRRGGDGGPPVDAGPPTKDDRVDDDRWGAGDAGGGGDDGGWGDGDDDGGGGDDDWGGGGGTADVSMDDLEAMMNDCKMRPPAPSSGSKPPPPPPPSAKSLPSQGKHDGVDAATECGGSSTTTTRDVPPSFENLDLLTINEPPMRRGGKADDSDDEDEHDDDAGGGGGCDVDAMLSRYLDVEDDEEILSALRGGTGAGGNRDGSCGGGSGGGGGERYERLPPEERAFLSFTRRLRRVPGQVARYAYGGVPLWSVPTWDRRRHNGGASGQQQQRKTKKSKIKKPQQGMHPSRLPDVPRCACGAGRVFEFQVLPSLLHVLDVDGHAAAVGARGKEDGDDDNDVMDLINSGGMNWGSIAVYSCPLSCDDSREEFVIVQEAVGDAPTRKVAEKGDDSDGDD